MSLISLNLSEMLQTSAANLSPQATAAWKDSLEKALWQSRQNGGDTARGQVNGRNAETGAAPEAKAAMTLNATGRTFAQVSPSTASMTQPLRTTIELSTYSTPAVTTAISLGMLVRHDALSSTSKPILHNTPAWAARLSSALQRMRWPESVVTVIQQNDDTYLIVGRDVMQADKAKEKMKALARRLSFRGARVKEIRLNGESIHHDE